jgi:GH25 family lysozyme M1 (1,4-beta-N-acetylmuramidase)
LKRKKKFSLRQTTTLLLLLGVAVVLGVVSSDSIHGRWAHPKSILVNGNYAVVDDSLRLNRFSEEDFSRESDGRVRYLPDQYRTGVDVSLFQGKVDWAKVAADGIDFAIVRAGSRSFSDGSLRLDKQFKRNVTKAAENGLDVGVYFFSQAVNVEEAVEEADFLAEQMKGLNITLPVVFNWEEVDATVDEAGISRTRNVDSETVNACALAFLQRIEAAGYRGMLYCNGDNGYFVFDMALFQDYPLWYASYATDWPDFYYGVDLWQYSDTGTVEGIRGAVDLSIWPAEEIKEDTPTEAVNEKATPS